MTELAKEYGDGLYALAVEEGMQREWLEQLKVLKACFQEQNDFIKLLSNMSMSKEERTAILDQTLRGQVHPYILNFLKILCDRGAMHEFAGCEAAYRTQYNTEFNIVEAVVSTCVPLDEMQKQQLITKLQDMTGKKIDLIEKIDETLLGGVVLEMNGKRYDNSVAHRLSDLHRMIAGLD